MTQTPISTRLGSDQTVVKRDTLVDLLQEVKDLLMKHVLGTPDHLRVITQATMAMQNNQSRGLVAAYEINDITPDTIHMTAYMPLDKYDGDNRVSIRRELRAIARRQGLDISVQLLPEPCADGEQS